MTTPKRGIGHTTLQNLGTFAGKYKLSLFEALFSKLARRHASGQGGGQPARVRPLRERPGVPRPPHAWRGGFARLHAGMVKDIAYEKHLYDGEDNEKVAASRWTNVLEFCDWMSQRAGGESMTRRASPSPAKRKACWRVAQTIALLSTISEREQDQTW